MHPRETQITMVKWTNAGGQTKRANERSFVCRPPAWRRWRNVKTTFWAPSNLEKTILIYLFAKFRFFIFQYFIAQLKSVLEDPSILSAAEVAWTSLSTITWLGLWNRSVFWWIACLGGYNLWSSLTFGFSAYIEIGLWLKHNKTKLSEAYCGGN